MNPIWRRILCIANGEIDSLAWVKEYLPQFDAVVAVDGGVRYCAALGFSPDMIVGDLDSAPPEVLEQYHETLRLTVPRDKDQTDLEIALEAIQPATRDQVVLIGAFGGRVDHLLGNLYLLTRYPKRVRAVSRREEIWSIDDQESLTVSVGQELSLLPLGGPVIGVTTRGLKWELNGKTLDKSFLGISNICVQEEVEIKVASGDLLISLRSVTDTTP